MCSLFDTRVLKRSPFLCKQPLELSYLRQRGFSESCRRLGVKSHAEFCLLKCNQALRIAVESQAIRNLNRMATLTKNMLICEVIELVFLHFMVKT